MTKPTERTAITESRNLRETTPSNHDALARAATHPVVSAAGTAQKFNSLSSTPLDLTALVDELSDQCVAVHKGDLRRAESLLTAQAHTLDAIFHNLARRAAANLVQHLDAADRYMRLALKAQSQCRATLETLAAIKNPPSLAFVKQANIAHGPQQVNNGESPRAREIESQKSKQLEQLDGQRLDTRATGTASDADSQLETVGAVHRTEDTRG